MDKKRKSGYFQLLLVLSVVLLGSCHHRSEEDEMAIRALRMATEELERQNNNIYMRLSLMHESSLGKMNKEYKKSLATKPLFTALDQYEYKSNIDISVVKSRYVLTLSSLSKIVYPDALDNIFNPLIDSTFNFFEDDDELLFIKMQFDINRIVHTIISKLLYGEDKQVDLYYDRDSESQNFIFPLESSFKKGDKFSMVFNTPINMVEYMKVFVDSITFNDKDKVPFHLNNQVCVIDLDSKLQKARYIIKGQVVYNSIKERNTFLVKPFQYTYNVNN